MLSLGLFLLAVEILTVQLRGQPGTNCPLPEVSGSFSFAPESSATAGATAVAAFGAYQVQHRTGCSLAGTPRVLAACSEAAPGTRWKVLFEASGECPSATGGAAELSDNVYTAVVRSWTRALVLLEALFPSPTRRSSPFCRSYRDRPPKSFRSKWRPLLLNRRS